MYCGVIIPLLEAYPGCAHIPDRYGSMLDELLSTLSDHIALADETDRDNMEVILFTVCVILCRLRCVSASLCKYILAFPAAVTEKARIYLHHYSVHV